MQRPYLIFAGIISALYLASLIGFDHLIEAANLDTASQPMGLLPLWALIWLIGIMLPHLGAASGLILAIGRWKAEHVASTQSALPALFLVLGIATALLSALIYWDFSSDAAQRVMEDSPIGGLLLLLIQVPLFFSISIILGLLVLLPFDRRFIVPH